MLLIFFLFAIECIVATPSLRSSPENLYLQKAHNRIASEVLQRHSTGSVELRNPQRLTSGRIIKRTSTDGDAFKVSLCQEGADKLAKRFGRLTKNLLDNLTSARNCNIRYNLVEQPDHIPSYYYDIQCPVDPDGCPKTATGGWTFRPLERPVLYLKKTAGQGEHGCELYEIVVRNQAVGCYFEPLVNGQLAGSQAPPTSLDR